ncbi:hypothetical protein [Bathymodiolus thermophilus thioautotrophic gill symbiont]|nr:hypothetical protein [Bathymodiolus thermophilus thioautotrophic gill symbiont]
MTPCQMAFYFVSTFATWLAAMDKNGANYAGLVTITEVETAHMIRKRQLSEENIPAYK